MEPTYGTVTAYDPDNYGVFVVLDGPAGQSGPMISVEVGTHGPRDAVRGHYPELPLPGQRGLIMFPRGDMRNATWVCSVRSGLNDSNPNIAGNMPQHFELAYGGGIFWRGPDGSEFTEYPDGSTLQVGPSQPTVMRHTVNANQARTATPFPLNQRVGAAPGASFGLVFTQAGTGASLRLTPAGGWVMTAAAGQEITLQTSGGSSIVLSTTVAVSGNTTVTGFIDSTSTISASGEVTAIAGADAVGLSSHRHGVGTPTAAGTVVPTPGT